MANWVKSFFEQNPDKAAWPIYKRAKYSIAFRRPDGKIEESLSNSPIHYQDILGEWHPLDTKLIAISSELGAPGLSTRIALDGTVRIEGGIYSQRSTRVGVFNSQTKKFTAVKTLPLGVVQDDQLIAENDVFKRVLTLTETGLREEIIISAQPTGLTQLVNDWAVLETIVTGKTFPDGWLADFSSDGFMFPPPRAYDANRNEAPCKRYARTVGGVQYIYTGVPVLWLNTAVYPVTIDPTYETFTASGSWTCPAGVTSVKVEMWAGGGGGYRGASEVAGGGAGGGAYSRLNAFVCTPGNSYAYVVGTGGASSTDGVDTNWVNAATGLAKAGKTGTPSAGGAGGASASGVGNAKYSGGTGYWGSPPGGGGGESGYASGVGTTATSQTGASGTDGGNGGNGGNANSAGSPGTAPGGGGGGGGEPTGASKAGGAGAAGKIVLTYTIPAGSVIIWS
jgi:hypothetical protein